MFAKQKIVKFLRFCFFFYFFCQLLAHLSSEVASFSRELKFSCHCVLGLQELFFGSEIKSFHIFSFSLSIFLQLFLLFPQFYVSDLAHFTPAALKNSAFEHIKGFSESVMVLTASTPFSLKISLIFFYFWLYLSFFSWSHNIFWILTVLKSNLNIWIKI